MTEQLELSRQLVPALYSRVPRGLHQLPGPGNVVSCACTSQPDEFNASRLKFFMTTRTALLQQPS